MKTGEDVGHGGVVVKNFAIPIATLVAIAAVAATISLKSNPCRKLKCPRAAGTKHLGYSAGRLPEPCAEQVAASAPEIGDIEQIENFT